MCAEITTKIIRTDTLLDQIGAMWSKGQDKGRITCEIIGTIIMTKYNRKTYRIDDIDWNQTPASTFEKKGTSETYAKYYLDRYNIKVRDMLQPMLVSLAKDRDKRGGRPEPVLLVPELCYMTGQSDEMRNNYTLQTDIASFTKMDPKNRNNRLQNLTKRLRDNPNSKKVFKDWSMDLEPDLVSLNGRRLAREDINIGLSKAVQGKDEVDGGDWGKITVDVKGVQRGLTSSVYQTVNLTKWCLIYPAKDRDLIFKNFASYLEKDGPKVFATYEKPLQIGLNDTRTSTYLKALHDVVGKGPNIIVVVIPSEKGDTYSCIKKFLCIDQPVPSQIVTISKVIRKEKIARSTTTKIALQMIAKMGGMPWSIKIPFKQGCMVAGFDTYHDTVNKGNSFGALVASYNQELTKYFSAVSKHAPNTEMSDQISALFSQALSEYIKMNGSPPSRIFFYRDGVGEGQVRQVYEHELKKIIERLDSFGDSVPKLAYIIVTKRINTK